MTGKEALRMLETRCRYFATDNLEIEETYEARSIIEKDLEVLEILKYLINEIDEDFIIEKIIDGVKVGYSNIKDYFINNDFTGKVKEMLEKWQD